MTRPVPKPGVLDIAAYIPGKSAAPGVAKVFKLSANETPLGPSPRAVEAFAAAAAVRGAPSPAASARTLRRRVVFR